MTKRKRGAESIAIDDSIASRVREMRIMRGLTQQHLGDLIGVTYQQAHKYECGVNRISASRLWKISQVLKVPIADFFEGLDGAHESAHAPLQERMALELAKNFSQIENKKHQEALSYLARALAQK